MQQSFEYNSGFQQSSLEWMLFAIFMSVSGASAISLCKRQICVSNDRMKVHVIQLNNENIKNNTIRFKYTLFNNEAIFFAKTL